MTMANEVQGTEKVRLALGRWAPSDLAYVERLEFHGDSDGSGLTIVGLFQRRDSAPWPDMNGAMRRVTLRFEGVNALHIKGFGGGYTQVMGFDIRSISERGWEDADFEVEDYEDGRIGFTCSLVEVVAVEEEDLVLP